MTIQRMFGAKNPGLIPNLGMQMKKSPIFGVVFAQVWSETPNRIARGGGQGLSMAAPDGLFAEVSGLFRVFSTRGLARFARPFSRGFFRDLGVIVKKRPFTCGFPVLQHEHPYLPAVLGSFFRDLGVIVSEFQSFIEINYSKSCQKPPCAREAILHG
ncbi:MAG TPA: hypothetical protein H9801_08605 [Candidatus Collinsella stercoripullorum]|nr:hypothetical protein [Candidatus Collinsella stercoripullorum]